MNGANAIAVAAALRRTAGILRRSAAALRRAVAALLLIAAACTAHANTASYATSGSGTFASSLAWLDFSGYADGTASGASGQAYSWTLPGGVGTLSARLKKTGGGSMVANAEPAWSGGGAFGHGAYNGISGSPILYWLNQTGTGTATLTGMTLKDAAGLSRTFSFYAADGENTNNPESITYTSTAAWTLLETVFQYGSYNGGSPTYAGLGSATVIETAPTTTDNNFNAAVILTTQNPSQVAVAFSGNEAALFAVSLPTIALNVVVTGRIAPADQFNAVIGYTSPAATLKTVATSGTATTAAVPATSIIGTNSVTFSTSMVAGSTSALSAYTNSMACSNSGPGASFYGGTNTVLPGGTGTTFTVTPQTGDNITCTLTLSPPQTIAGSVYSDTNANANQDGAEGGTSISGLYVKLSSFAGGVCQTPATAAAAVSSATGAFSLPSIYPGAYCLTLTNSAALGNVTAYLPPGWVGTQNASGVIQLMLTGVQPAVQNFGLYNGSAVSIQVFDDNGAGGGTANNGLKDGTETGLAGVTLIASAGAGVVGSAVTTASGAAVLWVPATAAGTVTIAPTAPSGYLATGGSPGTTKGTYARPSVSFTSVAGMNYSGVSFGLIPPNAFAPNGTLATPAGTTVFYAHSFTAGSAGQLSFAATASASPATAGWSETLYLDASCSGQYASGDAQITAALAVTAQQQVCVILREFVPQTAAANAANKVSLNATLTYGGAAAPAAALSTVVDTTTVSGPGTLQLSKQVLNVGQGSSYGASNSALPGSTLQYQITLTNLGTAPVSNVVVNDATPAFTSFLSASCPAAAGLPLNISACAVTAQPAAGTQGAVTWTFVGALASGGQTTVTYQVQIAQ